MHAAKASKQKEHNFKPGSFERKIQKTRTLKVPLHQNSVFCMYVLVRTSRQRSESPVAKKEAHHVMEHNTRNDEPTSSPPPAPRGGGIVPVRPGLYGAVSKCKCGPSLRPKDQRVRSHDEQCIIMGCVRYLQWLQYARKEQKHDDDDNNNCHGPARRRHHGPIVVRAGRSGRQIGHPHRTARSARSRPHGHLGRHGRPPHADPPGLFVLGHVRLSHWHLWPAQHYEQGGLDWSWCCSSSTVGICRTDLRRLTFCF